MNLNKKTILIGSTAAVAGLAAIAGPALATGAVSLPGGGDDDQHHEQFAQDLARELGVPQAQVDEALKAMQGDHLSERVDELQADGALTADQASAIKAQIAAGDVDSAMGALRTAMLEGRTAELVETGDLTQPQADQVLALAAAGVPIGVGGPKGHDGDRPTPTAEQVIEHAQHEVEEGELTAQQAAKVESLAKAGKVDEAMATMMAARTAATAAELVEAGTITQAQADQVIALANAGAPVGFGGPGMGKGGDHGRGHGGDHRGDHHGDHHGDRHGDEMGGAPPMGEGMGGAGEPTGFDGA